MMNKTFDVVIIGSGHSGGMAGKVLTKQGISCLVLNAGPVADADKDTEVRPAYALPFRGFRKPDQVPHVFQASEFNANVWVDEEEVPYTHAPGEPYNWVRVRLFGGRSLFWSRACFRLSDYEFKGKSHDGYGDDWPIDLAEMAPYYARVEEIFQVRGRRENLPQMPDGHAVADDTKWSTTMERFVTAAAKAGIPVCKKRYAVGRNDLASSVNLLLPDAFATGKLEAVSNVVVSHLSTDKRTGKIDEVHFMDRLSRRQMSVKARVVVLAAGTLESTRLLLNSKIANSSGLLGHYLTDQTYGVGIVASVPEARDGRGTAEMIGDGGVIPRFRNIGNRTDKFLRGYALTVNSSRGAMDANNFAEYGAALEKKLDSYAGSHFSLGIMGEVLARYENHVRIDAEAVDTWGIPALRIETKYGPNEFAMAQDAVDTGVALCEAAGFEVLAKNAEPNPPGYSIHELGTCRMGDDPKHSVLNRWNQSHDVKNLFVVDGSSFVSAGWQNPTLTITALAMRAAEHLAGEMKKLNL